MNKDFRPGDKVTVITEVKKRRGFGCRGVIKEWGYRNGDTGYYVTIGDEVFHYQEYELFHGHNVTIQGEEVPERCEDIVIRKCGNNKRAFEPCDWDNDTEVTAIKLLSVPETFNGQPLAPVLKAWLESEGEK